MPSSPIKAKQMGLARRKRIALSPARLTKSGRLRPNHSLPLVVQPTAAGVDLLAWAAENREWLEKHLLEHGGILFRGFHPRGTDDFQRFCTLQQDPLQQYVNRSTPRSQVAEGIYTSTEYPPEQTIPLHAECAYSREWPGRIFFYCQRPASEGGATPIADNRRIYQRLDPRIRDRFLQEGVLYVRNYGSQLDLPWQDVFQTSNPREVENYCRNRGIVYEWLEGGRLRTHQHCQAAVIHPGTGERVWFNQAHLFHISALHSRGGSALLSLFGEDGLPRNARYGNGEAIEAKVIADINQLYWEYAVDVFWEAGDILMLDNMLTAHGRRPFKGQRRVLVAMTRPVSGDDVQSEPGRDCLVGTD